MRACRVAGEIAARFKGRLVIVHVRLAHASADQLADIPGASRWPKGVRDRLREVRALSRRTKALAAEVVTVTAPADVVEAVDDKILAATARAAQARGARAVAKTMASCEPAQAIIAAADREKADLVVLGSRGLGAIRGLLMGSVSHKVAQVAPCPCLMVK